MGFSSRGERLCSTLNTIWKVGIYSQEAEYMVCRRLLREKIGDKSEFWQNRSNRILAEGKQDHQTSPGR